MNWEMVLPILSGIWAVCGAVVTPLFYARKYRDPRRGMLLGALAGGLTGPLLLLPLWFAVPALGEKCPKCGHVIAPNALVCSNCGYSIVPSVKVQQGDTPVGDLEIATDVPQPSIPAGPSFMREIVETLVLIAAIYAFVNLATARFVVDGQSMLPNFNTQQFIIVSRLSYIIGDPERGDVVVFHAYDPDQPECNSSQPTRATEGEERDFIKRVIGLPGETVTIQAGRVYINNHLIEEPYIDPTNWCRGTTCDGTWEIGPDQYFVLGDNRSASKDSQDFGPISRKCIVGKAFVRYWPPQDWQLIPHHGFSENGAPLPTLTPTPLVTPTYAPSVPSYVPSVGPLFTPTPFPGGAIPPLPTATATLEGSVQD